MLRFETILPFLRSLEPLILDDSVSEIVVNGLNLDPYSIAEA